MNSLFEFPSFTFVILRLENIQLTRVARELELHTFFFCGECLFLLNLWPRIRMQILKTDVPEKSNRFLASSSIPFFVFFLPFLFFLYSRIVAHRSRDFFVLMKRGKWRFARYFLLLLWFLPLSFSLYRTTNIHSSLRFLSWNNTILTCIFVSSRINPTKETKM